MLKRFQMDNLNDIALLVIDVQKGLFEKPIPIYEADNLVENICLLADRAHEANIPVFFIQHSSEKILPKGTDGWQFHPKIQPLKSDRIIPKQHGSAFIQTTLQAELEARQIKRVVVTGLVTHGCVRATCLDAQKLGYKVILVEDGHSSYHRQAKKLIDEWNKKLSQGIVELRTAQELDFHKLGAG
jgi:nicotinamidase-related amidase